MARLATILTTLALVGLSGGALAVAQLDSHPNRHGGAANDQYTPGVAQKPTTATSTVTAAQSTVGAVTTPSTSTAPTTSAARSTQAATTSRTLPFTGEEVLTVILVGLLLIGSGVLLVQARARRREDQ